MAPSPLLVVAATLLGALPPSAPPLAAARRVVPGLLEPIGPSEGVNPGLHLSSRTVQLQLEAEDPQEASVRSLPDSSPTPTPPPSEAEGSDAEPSVRMLRRLPSRPLARSVRGEGQCASVRPHAAPSHPHFVPPPALSWPSHTHRNAHFFPDDTRHILGRSYYGGHSEVGAGGGCAPGALLHHRDGFCCLCGERGDLIECGPPSSSLCLRSSKIVGGHTTTISRHRYMLALEMWQQIICGATIIGNRWALTAAHCLKGIADPLRLKLRAGTSSRGSGGRVFRLKLVLPHPNYDPATFAHDICLMRVTRPFTHAAELELEPARLPTPAAPPLAPGTQVTLVGWGLTEEKGSLSDELREVTVPLVDLQYCRRVFGRIIRDEMLCAGAVEGGRDACQADSGGPMMLNGTVVGVVSFGEGCARADRPGVFTSVAAYRRWIHRQTRL